VAVLHDAGNHVAAAFNHTRNDDLVVLASAILAADYCVIDLKALAVRTAQGVVAVHIAHVVADQAGHAPSRLVGHADGALDFLGAQAVTRCAEQEHDVEPVAQARAGLFKRRPGGGIDLIAAMLALIRTARLHAVVFGLALALGADVPLAVAGAHQVFKAGVFGREPLLELAEGRTFRGGLLFHGQNMPGTGLHAQKG